MGAIERYRWEIDRSPVGTFLTMCREIDRLGDWKLEAISVLSEWDKVFDKLPPHNNQLGRIKSEAVADYIEELQATVQNLLDERDQ